MQRLAFDSSEHSRLRECQLYITTISALNFEQLTARVWLEGYMSAEIPWPADVGRNYRRWKPLQFGQQVIIACESGDFSQATIVGTLYSNTFPSPSKDQNIDLVQFNDGSYVQYDSRNRILTCEAPNGIVRMIAGNNYISVQPEGIYIKGNVQMLDKLQVEKASTFMNTVLAVGEIKSNADVKAGAISLTHHTHYYLKPSAGTDDKTSEALV